MVPRNFLSNSSAEAFMKTIAERETGITSSEMRGRKKERIFETKKVRLRTPIIIS